MQKCFIAEQKDTFLASGISYLRPSSYMWTFQQAIFSRSANFSMTATPFIFQILSDSTVGVALHFWGVPSPLPPTPLPVLCHAGITISTLASTPHLSKPSGKYRLPWITHCITKVQSQRHLVKTYFGFLSKQWGFLLMLNEKYAQCFPKKFTTMTLIRRACILSTWIAMKLVGRTLSY